MIKTTTDTKIILNVYLYICMSVLGIYISSYQVIFSKMMVVADIALALGGVLISMHFIGSLFIPVLTGELADKVGKKKILLLAFTVFAISAFCLAISHNILLISVLIFFVGGAFAVIEGLGSAILCDANPENSRKVLNISQMFFCLGCFAGPIFASFILGKTDNYRIIYYMAALIMLLLIISGNFINLPPLKLKVQNEQNGSFTGIVLKSPGFLLLVLLMFLYVGVEEGCAFWTVTYIKYRNASMIAQTMGLSFFWLSMGLGRLVVSFVNVKIHQYWIILSLLLSAFSISIIVYATSISEMSFIILFCLIGFGFGPIWPLLMDAGIAKTKYTSTSANILMSASALGAGTIPFIMGGVSESFGVNSSFILLLTIVISIILIIILANKTILKKSEGSV